MHIKTLTIYGFKSYRDQTAVEEFSPAHNVVVGRNGSGKSNFFAAIRFVLADEYTSLSREDRQALLHDSSATTATTLSAYVEIVFDNADGRFPSNSGSTDLVLRRTIGVKKDEYSIDRKSATKSDVMNLLEAAGFSRSNPYYIVPQGRITHLTNMRDADRLNLLKDVAGTKVYETRRADSIKIMDETEEKKEKIMESLQYIQEQLAQLDEERKELREYHDKDKERKALEQALLQQEMRSLSSKLIDLDDKRASELRSADEQQMLFIEREKERKALEDEAAKLKHSMAVRVAEQEALSRERRDLTKARAELEAAINDSEDNGGLGTASRDDLNARLTEIIGQISAAEGELMGLQSELEDKMRNGEAVQARLDDARSRAEILDHRRMRSARYASIEERNAAIEEQIASLDALTTQHESSRSALQGEERLLSEGLMPMRQTLQEKVGHLDSRRTYLETAAAKWTELREQEDELLERKKVLWKEQHSLISSANSAGEQLTIAERRLRVVMDHATATGLSNLDRVTERLGLQGVHGPLYKLFSVEDTYEAAAEAAAGPSLFHVVVDTDQTATQLIRTMNAEKLGRITFIPLNRVSPRQTNFAEKDDAFKLFKKLRFDPAHTKAIQQIFGRTVVCSSLKVASSYVQSNADINAITLDGDKMERKGAITGGYRDPSKSRLTAAKELQQWQDIVASNEARLRSIEQEVHDLEQEITMLASERSQLEAKSKRYSKSREPLRLEIRDLRDAISTCESRQTKLRESIARAERDLSSAASKQQALRQELAMPLGAAMSVDDLAELRQLQAQTDEFEQEAARLRADLSKTTSQKELLQVELDGNLKRERDATEAQLEAISSLGRGSQDRVAQRRTPNEDVKNQKRRLAGVRAQLSDRQKSLEKLERSLDKESSRLKEIEDTLDELQTAEFGIAKAITKHENVLNRVISKRRELEKREAEMQQKIRELGVVPGDVAQKYLNSDPNAILKRLHAVQGGLQKFSSVNRQAIEQYDKFAKQRDELIQREAELRRSSDSIQELIGTLDMHKDEAIERTFRQVSQNFAEVFERLVPAGRGDLKILTRHDASQDSDEDAEMDEDDSEEAAARRASRIENYVGVSIEVSFHSREDEGLRIQQLSGGQKSLVALAIVFAIQKCDPAAFYLFDEIDANLDAQYRTAVAAMIQELSKNAQFITTTFRPELVGVGDKHYGVFFSNQKVSSLRPITQDDAYQFVEAAAEAT